MYLFWKYRLFLVLFLPSLLLGTTSFFQGLISCFFLLWGGVSVLLCLSTLRFLQVGKRAYFYFYLFLFCALVYLPYPFFVDEILSLFSWGFWIHFSTMLPLIPLSLVFLEEENLKVSARIRDFSIILAFFCILFLSFGFLRDLLDFQEFHLWKGPWGTISLTHLLEDTKFSILSNSFFSSPTGGVFIIGLTGAIFYGRMRKKYES